MCLARDMRRLAFVVVNTVRSYAALMGPHATGSVWS